MIILSEAAAALEAQARDEIRSLTDAEALLASDQLLSMAATAWYPPEKEQSLGLIERQRILYRPD